MATLLALRDVRFAHPPSRAGDARFALAIDALDVGAAERVALIGPSGCGKSTLLDLLAGVRRADAGSIFLEDRELGRLGDAARRRLRLRRLGMVFQDFALLEALTALDNILLPFHLGAGLRVTRAVRERARDLAARVGVEHALRRRPAHLSHGERQRVALCRAMVTRPAALLCDEPTGSLDPARSAAVLDLLFDEAAEVGAAVVVATHDHALLDRFDRVVEVGAFAGAAETVG